MTQLPPHHRTDRIVRRIERHLEQITGAITLVNSLMGYIMANQQDALTEIGKLKQAILDDQTGDQAVVDALDAALANAVVNADTQPLIDAIHDAQASITAVKSSSTPPAP